MTARALFSARPAQWVEYERPLRHAFDAADLDVDLVTEGDPATIDYVIYAPSGGLSDLTAFTRLKAVLSLWAGVEQIVTNPTITAPLCRMVDSGLTEGMVEWVTGHVLRHHLGMDAHIHGQDGVWRDGTVPPLARDRPIGILGLGALGLACGEALANLNFPVSGWSRSAKSHDQITCHSGKAGLTAVLATSEVLVLLTPQTPQTEHLLNAQTLALLPKGAFILNPGRGPLIDDAALLDTMDSGQVAHATLDVFATEPLPADHPYWSHPSVTVTPHIASATRAATASLAIAENIRRGEAGEPFRHVVDRQQGY